MLWFSRCNQNQYSMTRKPYLLLMAGIFYASLTQAQFFAADNPNFDVSLNVGASSYFGDLTESAKLFNQSSYAFNAGATFNYNPHIAFRADIGYCKVQAADSKNSRADLKARNLSFKSNILDFSLAVEYNVLDIINNHRFTPYVFGGVGFSYFNPYTTDRFGAKQTLQPLGTEGQGLAAYPDRKPYKRTVLSAPLGGGIKYAISDRVTLGAEFKYHYLNSDYLDDVSHSGYPDKAILATKNPNLPYLTYRGDELPGGAPYPSASMNRGNPNNKDIYYSTQIRVIYSFGRITE